MNIDCTLLNIISGDRFSCYWTYELDSHQTGRWIAEAVENESGNLSMVDASNDNRSKLVRAIARSVNTAVVFMAKDKHLNSMTTDITLLLQKPDKL